MPTFFHSVSLMVNIACKCRLLSHLLGLPPPPTRSRATQVINNNSPFNRTLNRVNSSSSTGTWRLLPPFSRRIQTVESHCNLAATVSRSSSSLPMDWPSMRCLVPSTCRSNSSFSSSSAMSCSNSFNCSIINCNSNFSSSSNSTLDLSCLLNSLPLKTQ